VSRVDYKLVTACVALAVLCSLGGGLAISVIGTGWSGLALVLGLSVTCAVVFNVLFHSRASTAQRRILEQVALAVGGSDEHAENSFVQNVNLPEYAAVLSAIDDMQARLREETVARQVGTSRSHEILSVLQSLSDPVFVFDRFGTIRLSNHAAESMVLADATLEGSDIRSIFTDGPLSDLLCAGISEGCIESRAVEIEFQIPKITSDEDRVYDARTFSIGDQSGGPYVLAMRDLTRERQISRMKSDFVSKASHELRTPLASIRGYLEMLVDGEAESEETQKQFIESMLADTERLSSLVENMLNISRIEAGIVRPQLDHSDLGEIARHVAHMLEPFAADKKIQVTTATAPGDLSVEGDSTMLHEVVLNLATNAIKYTPDGGRVTISVDTDSLERSVLVAVTDTGLGIPLESRERVFEKFFRVPSYERMAQGTGLGLNLCRNIVESVHQGRIGVDSTMGEGSRFWFSIPMGFAGARAA
jgi:two-component system phosphate regulon sensor histidine kinase PhoR